MSRVTPANLFYQNLETFFNDLKVAYPSEEFTVEKYKAKIHLMNKMNNRVFISKFKEYIYPHAQEIEDCNEDYFLEPESADKMVVSNEGKELIDLIKSHWETTSDDNKICIWGHLNTLLENSKLIK